MLPIERQQRIINELNINGRVIVSELVTLCQVSQETIRRDLSQLEKEDYYSAVMVVLFR